MSEPLIEADTRRDDSTGVFIPGPAGADEGLVPIGEEESRPLVQEEPDSFAQDNHVFTGDQQYGSLHARSYSSQSIATEYAMGQNENDTLRILQAVVFIEDSAAYRSIDHKVDKNSLMMYRLYHSMAFSLLRYFVICLLHILAFFEFPSSLTVTSDARTRGERVEFPCGVTEGIELVCLLFLAIDVAMKIGIYGWQHMKVNRWLVVEIFCLVVSAVDWSVSLGIGCKEVVRVRRMLRPVFIIQNSSLMKKILNSLRKTLSQILGVLMLMALHLYVFTLFGMLLFPKPAVSKGNHSVSVWEDDLAKNTSDKIGASESEYFRTLTDSFMDLLVLLTTANNPDVTLPAYSLNRFYAIFFIIFLIIGLYCFMNMLTAIIYNQFRDYFKNSMQSSLNRRRLGQRAAYECLKKKNMLLNTATAVTISDNDSTYGNKVSVRDLKIVVSKASVPKDMKVLLIKTIAEGFTQDQMLTWNQFLAILHMAEKTRDQVEKPRIRWFQNTKVRFIQHIFAHKNFSYFGTLMAFVNVILITVELGTEYDKSISSSKSALRIINFMFILYYIIEQSLILICLGWRRYTYTWGNIFDGVIVLILAIGELITVGMYGFPFFSNKEVTGNMVLWNIVRVINVLIMTRLLRIIWHIKAMAIVGHTLLDLVKNLQSFGGIVVVIYYSFAILGMELFQGVIPSPSNTTNSSSYKCGSYEQLEYWANNFDDFAAAIVVLWDVMVVNNWFIFLDEYQRVTKTKWSYLFFIAWWLISVVLVLNLFTALILENFIMKWDKFNLPQQQEEEEQSGRRRRPPSGSASLSYNINTLTVHDLFRPNLSEPMEEDILAQLSTLKYFTSDNYS